MAAAAMISPPHLLWLQLDASVGQLLPYEPGLLTVGAGVEARLEAILTWQPPLVLGQWWPCVLVLAGTEVILHISSGADAQQLADEVHGCWDVCSIAIFIPASKGASIKLSTEMFELNKCAEHASQLPHLSVLPANFRAPAKDSSATLLLSFQTHHMAMNSRKVMCWQLSATGRSSLLK